MKKNSKNKVYNKLEIVSLVASTLIIVACFLVFGLSTVDFFARIGDVKLLINIFLSFIAIVFTFCSVLAIYAKDLTKNKNLATEIKKIISGIIFSSISIIFVLVLGHIVTVFFSVKGSEISSNVLQCIMNGYVWFLVTLVSVFFSFLCYCFLLFVLEFIFLFDEKYAKNK